MDGVVADFVAGVCRTFDRPCPYKDHPERRGTKYWGIEDLMGIDKELFWGSLDENFWRLLPRTVEADHIIGIARSFIDNYNICFLTSPCRTRGCYEGKLRWAEQNFPGIPVIFSSSTRKPDGSSSPPPKHMFASRDSMLIDDHEPNVDGFTLAKGHAFLFPRYWNKHHCLHSSWFSDLECKVYDFSISGR